MEIKYIITSVFMTCCLILLGGATACSTDDPELPTETPAGPGNNEDNNSGEPEKPVNTEHMEIQVKIGETTFTATLQENATAAVFKEMLPLTLSMSDLNRNEKYYNFSGSLPTAASNPGTIRTGDLMLYGSNSLVLFYKTFSSSYSYTRIGAIDNPSGLESAVGAGNVTISFSITE